MVETIIQTKSSYFNSRAPCGARPDKLRCCFLQLRISTHVPHAGHDSSYASFNPSSLIFQLTCPMRGTTNSYARPSHSILFQLTCPMRGTTADIRKPVRRERISTHVPHAGHDEVVQGVRERHDHFNSRAPCGARPSFFVFVSAETKISTHVPHAGHDRISFGTEHSKSISTHVPHAGHDPEIETGVLICSYFNSRAPCGARLVRLHLLPHNCHFNSRAPCGARL